MVDESRALSVPAPRLPYPADAEKFGFNAETWRVLTEAIFPNARSPHSVVLALAYCKARGLDPMKRPVHIVPIWDSKHNCEVETIWPGIGELRTTAARTGSYAGRDETVFGPNITETFKDEKGEVTVTFPEWARITVYRMVEGQKCAFVGPKVYWRESYASRSSKTLVPNQMWTDRPSGQLEKCAEAASLRAAYPEEIGNDYAAEEMEGRKFQSFGKTPEGHEILLPKRKSETVVPANPPTVIDAKVEASPATAPIKNGNGNHWRGTVASCTVKKQGQKNGKPYTIYTITAKDGKRFDTFSDTHADLASSCAKSGEEIIVEYKTTDYGNDAVSVEVAGVNEPGAEG